MPANLPADAKLPADGPQTITVARALLGEVVALQTAPPRRQAGRDLLARIRQRLDKPAADAASDARACEMLLQQVRAECLGRHGIPLFPRDPARLPPLDEAGLALFTRIDEFLSGADADSDAPPTDNQNPSENEPKKL